MLRQICTITNQRSISTSVFYIFLCLGWLSCGFIPISSSRSSTSSSRCRSIRKTRSTNVEKFTESKNIALFLRLAVETQDASLKEKIEALAAEAWIRIQNAKVSRVQGPKKSGCFKETRFQKSWSTKWNDWQMLTTNLCNCVTALVVRSLESLYDIEDRAGPCSDVEVLQVSFPLTKLFQIDGSKRSGSGTSHWFRWCFRWDHKSDAKGKR